jgi:hypothetical protein
MEKNFGFWFGAKVFSTPWCVVTKKEVPTFGKAGTSTTKTKTYGKNQDAYIRGVSVS